MDNNQTEASTVVSKRVCRISRLGHVRRWEGLLWLGCSAGSAFVQARARRLQLHIQASKQHKHFVLAAYILPRHRTGAWWNGTPATDPCTRADGFTPWSCAAPTEKSYTAPAQPHLVRFITSDTAGEVIFARASRLTN
jgi:hypothetical protein